MANAKFTPRKSSAIIPEATAEEKEKETSVNTPKDEQNQTAGESNNSPAPEATAESEGSAEETSESTDTEKPEVKATSAVEFKPEVVVEKTTRIRSRVDHRCTIGGVHYDFVKGKTYNVPANVRDILSRNDLLSPL